MSPADRNRAVAIQFAAAIATIAASAPWAAPRLTDAQRAFNTYPKYQGPTGCVQDLGYGRFIEGCD